MKIIISNFSNEPIYRQIVEQIKMMIFKEELRRNDPLPSIRGLARDLKISVITTKRAYEELEKEGFIETIHGKGSFISGGNIELIKEKKIKLVEDKLIEVIEESKVLGFTYDDVIKILEVLYREV